MAPRIDCGPELRARFKHEGIRVGHVARAAGISKQHLSKCLNGEIEMGEPIVRVICMTFGFALEDYGLTDYRPAWQKRMLGLKDERTVYDEEED